MPYYQKYGKLPAEGPRPVSRAGPRRGRPKLWTPSMSPLSSFTKGEEFVKTWGPPTSQKEEVLRSFRAYCELNGIKEDTYALYGCVGEWKEVYSPGTIENYVRFIFQHYRRPGMKRVLSAAEAYHADAENQHAPDVEERVLLRYVEEAEGPWRIPLYLLWATGLRPRALAFLRKSQISIDPENLRVQVRVDKNRRKTALRCQLRIPWDWISEPSPEIIQELNEGSQRERLFQTNSFGPVPNMQARLNKELKRMAQEKSLELVTTYSFRRNFMNKVLERCPEEEKRRKYTLHFSPGMIHAHYERWKKN